MINDQVIWWMRQNSEVYIKGTLKQEIQLISNQAISKEKENLVKKIISKYMQILEQLLLEGKNVYFGDIVAFCIYKTKGSKDSVARRTIKHFLIGNIKKVILQAETDARFSSSLRKAVIPEDIYSKVASLLLLNIKVVQQAIKSYSKAILDLVLSNKAICLNLSFCQLMLDRRRSSCRFKTSLLAAINGQSKKKQTLISRFKPYRFQNQSEDKQNNFYDQKMQQIEEGNLFNYPSLRQVKMHLDKGKELTLKYKQSCQ